MTEQARPQWDDRYLPLLTGEYNTLSGMQQNAINAVPTTAANMANELTSIPQSAATTGANLASALPGIYMGPSTAQLGIANMGYNLPYMNLQMPEQLTAALGGMGGTANLTGTGTTTQELSPLSTALGLGIAGGSLLGGNTGLLNALGPAGLNWLSSDIRVKEDVEEIGVLNNGLAVYRFRYRGSPTTQIGVMAQDVERVKPEAVREINGTKYVNYDLATR